MDFTRVLVRCRSRGPIVAIYVDDEELVAAHKAGDGDAFDELVSEHRGLLLSLIHI